MRALLMVVTVSLLNAEAAHAADDSPSIPASLSCAFESYADAGSKKGQTQFIAAVHQYSSGAGFRYIEIDPKHGTARTGENEALALPVRLVVTTRAWVFINLAVYGDTTVVSTTTVFIQNEPEASLGIYRAVFSSQLVYDGEIMASQNYGHCQAITG